MWDFWLIQRRHLIFIYWLVKILTTASYVVEICEGFQKKKNKEKILAEKGD